jgi:hypothetical protein
MAKFCGQCGALLNATALFCGGCGTKVPVSAAPAPLPPQAPPPFTPVQPTTPAAPSAGYTPVASAFKPVDAAFSAVNPSEAETVAFNAISFDPVPEALATPVAPPADFAPVPGFTRVSVPPNPPPSSYSPVPPTPPAPVPQASDFAPVPGFAPIPAAYTPPASSYTPAPPPPPGAPVPGFTPTPASYTPPVSSYTPPAASYTPAQAPYAPAAAYPAKKSNTLLKVLIAFIVILFVGGALAVAGIWYAAQKIKAKVHDVKTQVMGEETPSTKGGLGGLLSGLNSDASSEGFQGDPCRFLSKAEVSKAVGLPVIRTEAKDDGCSYIAKGDPADVTAKHMSAMLGGMGADAKTQQMAQKLAGGFFAQQEASDKSHAEEAATGEVPVLVLSFSSGHAGMEMKMNRAAFARLGDDSSTGSPAHTTTGDLAGFGDEAYVAGGSMILLRKGNTVARFVYISCPCNTDNIKPLAKLVASRL